MSRFVFLFDKHAARGFYIEANTRDKLYFCQGKKLAQNDHIVPDYFFRGFFSVF